MKNFDTFADWFKEQPAKQKRMISELRKLVAKTSPKLIESSKWTNGVWLKGDLPLIFIHTEADHLQFGFFGGALLSDPNGLLRGKAKFVRHIRIEKMSDIDEAALATMIRKAVRVPPYKR